MPFYQKLGTIPNKRHVVFRKDDGKLYQEEVFGTAGFAGMASIMYHLHPPTVVVKYGNTYSVAPEIVEPNNMKNQRMKGFQVKPEDDYLESRKAVLTNSDATIVLASPRSSMKNYFYKNVNGDEMVFIHKGSGTLHTQLGKLPFKYGDYIIIPKGMIHRFEFDTDDNRLFIVESTAPIFTPKR